MAGYLGNQLKDQSNGGCHEGTQWAGKDERVNQNSKPKKSTASRGNYESVENRQSDKEW